MSAAELLARARATGLSLELDATGELWIEADHPPPPELLAELRANRAALATELRVEREFEAAAERRRAREAALIRDGDLALLAAERRALGPVEPLPGELAEAERDLARADRALAGLELDPALRAEGALAPAEPPRPEPPYPSGAAAPELPELDPLAARRLARAAELFAGGYVRTLRSHWRAWAPDRTAELERAIAELRGCTDRERAKRVFAAALLGDPA
jgi:hypothetical protein